MNDKSELSRIFYDNKGNLIVSTSNNYKDIVRYEYDSNDRITKIVYPTNATDKDELKTMLYIL